MVVKFGGGAGGGLVLFLLVVVRLIIVAIIIMVIVIRYMCIYISKCAYYMGLHIQHPSDTLCAPFLSKSYP